MKKVSLSLIAIACVALVTMPALGASVFLSEVGTVGGGVAAGNPVVDVMPGSSLTLYLWSSADQNYDTSIGMNVRSATAGVIDFTASAVQNPEILSMALGGAPAGVDRWQDVGHGVVTSESVTAMNAVKVNEGTGITSANNGTVGLFKYLDPLYDVPAGAFLLGSVSLDAVAAGSTTLSIDQTETALFVHAGGQVFPEFGTATINVAIPEPSSIVLLVLGLVALVGYRSNR